MEEINRCPICDHTSFTYQLTCKDYTSSNEVFEIKSCDNCSFYITSPRPTSESIGKYYISDNYISHSEKSKKNLVLGKILYSILKMENENDSNEILLIQQ